MTDTKLSDLTLKTGDMVAADLVEITEGGNTTKAITGTKILGYIGADNLAAVVNAATARGNLGAQATLTAGTGITIAGDGTISAGQIALTSVQIASAPSWITNRRSLNASDSLK